MSLGYVEELALRYFEKKGYVTASNIRFQLDKRKTRKKVAGWSDIDLLAVNPDEIVIIQCKSFLGTGPADKIAKSLIAWFGSALEFLKKDSDWSKWFNGRKVKKLLIVDWSVKKTENILKDDGIEIMYYDDMLKNLISILKSGDARKGKEDDAIIRLLCAMIDKKLINI